MVTRVSIFISHKWNLEVFALEAKSSFMALNAVYYWHRLTDGHIVGPFKTIHEAVQSFEFSQKPLELVGSNLISVDFQTKKRK